MMASSVHAHSNDTKQNAAEWNEIPVLKTVFKEGTERESLSMRLVME
jgi:hypothetical protein